jgi:hypothetical protein
VPPNVKPTPANATLLMMLILYGSEIGDKLIYTTSDLMKIKRIVLDQEDKVGIIEEKRVALCISHKTEIEVAINRK